MSQRAREMMANALGISLTGDGNATDLGVDCDDSTTSKVNTPRDYSKADTEAASSEPSSDHAPKDDPASSQLPSVR